MKTKIIPIILGIICWMQTNAQEKKLSLKEAITIGLEQSKPIKYSQSLEQTANLQVKAAKTNQYPDLKVSGQYLHLFDGANVKLKTGSTSGEGASSSGGTTPKYMMFGMANVSMPLFSGFKIRNSIRKSEYGVELAKIQTESQKEDVASQIIQVYFSMYKTKKSIEVLKENETRAQQRVVDFKNFMDNGLLARNDYLRATLQLSNVKLSLQEANNTYDNLNYRLNILLNQPENTKIEVTEVDELNLLPNQDVDLSARKDIQSLQQKDKIAETAIKIAKADYYPQLSLSGGYIAADLDDVFTLTNATNVGIGLSYNLASIFKNKSSVAIAKEEKISNEIQLATIQDQAKIEGREAYNAYNLAIKQNEVYNEAVEQANENYRIVKDKYDNGLTDTDQLLEADVEQLQAQINQVIGNVDEQLSLYNYSYIEGKLLETLQIQ